MPLARVPGQISTPTDRQGARRDKFCCIVNLALLLLSQAAKRAASTVVHLLGLFATMNYDVLSSDVVYDGKIL